MQGIYGVLSSQEGNIASSKKRSHAKELISGPEKIMSCVHSTDFRTMMVEPFDMIREGHPDLRYDKASTGALAKRFDNLPRVRGNHKNWVFVWFLSHNKGRTPFYSFLSC
ncbi:hypothetical protein AMTRI_Chr13g119410 [Amborella trichopoda]